LNEIKNVIQQLEKHGSAIDRALSALREIGDQRSTDSAFSAIAGRPKRRKYRMSAEGRRRIAEAARRRWAAKKEAASATQVSSPVKTKGRKRHLTPEGRERIAEATRRRWAAKRAADAAAQAKGKKML
jgi:hypothetical protein